MTVPDCSAALRRAGAARFSAYVDVFLPFPGHPALPAQPAGARAGLMAEVRAL